MYISKINIDNYNLQEQALINLMTEKFVLLNLKRSNGEKINLIEHWRLKHIVSQNTMYPILKPDNNLKNILQKEKEDLINRIITDPSLENRTGLYFIKLKLLQRTLNYSIPLNDPEYIKLLKEEIVDLESTILITLDPVRKVNREIELFYLNDNLENMESTKTIYKTKADSDLIINEKKKQYNIIIDLLTRKKVILKQRIASNYYKDSIVLIDKKIELKYLEFEIESKKEFLKHYEERKEIFS